MRYPVEGFKVTSPFGVRRDPITGAENAGHSGVDWGCPEGTPLRAVMAGEVYMVDKVGDATMEGNGNAVWLRVQLPESMRTLLERLVAPAVLNRGPLTAKVAYLHMSHLSELATRAPVRGSVGGKPVPVGEGNILGASGNTGRTTGPHLHFAIWVRTTSGAWVAVDPLPVLEAGTGANPEPRPLRVLHLGVDGGDVRVLQQALNALGYADPPLVVDGDFGPKTEAAVRAVQRANDLVVDGWVGPATRAVVF